MRFQPENCRCRKPASLICYEFTVPSGTVFRCAYKNRQIAAGSACDSGEVSCYLIGCLRKLHDFKLVSVWIADPELPGAGRTFGYRCVRCDAGALHLCFRGEDIIDRQRKVGIADMFIPLRVRFLIFVCRKDLDELSRRKLDVGVENASSLLT